MCSIYIDLNVHASDFDICIQDKGVSYFKPCVVFIVQFVVAGSVLAVPWRF